MDSEQYIIKIGYGGGLNPYIHPKKTSNFFKRWFWTYSPENIDASTRSPYHLFKAIELLLLQKKIKKGDLLIHLWGNIHNDNKKLVKKLKIEDYVTIEGYFSKNESLKKLHQCDIVFLPLESEKNGQKPLFLPGKLYEYLKLSKPVLALVGESDCKNILEKAGIGICVPPKDIEKIANKLLELLSNKQNLITNLLPNAEYIQSFSFEKKTAELAKVFDELI